MIVTCFGHSSFNEFEKYENTVMSFLCEKLKGEDVQFYLGGYGGFDVFFYHCCSRFKISNPSSRIMFITPYIKEEYLQKQLHYSNYIYDEIIYPDLESVPYKFAISYRNRWMFERADYVVCYINHRWGGAYQAYNQREPNSFVSCR